MSTANGHVESAKARRFRGLSAEQRRSKRREQLIEAGLETYGKLGFHAVGVREICAAAHLTERYFYESFENREALFLAAYDLAVARIRRAMEAALATEQGDVSTMARC